MGAPAATAGMRGIRSGSVLFSVRQIGSRNVEALIVVLDQLHTVPRDRLIVSKKQVVLESWWNQYSDGDWKAEYRIYARMGLAIGRDWPV